MGWGGTDLVAPCDCFFRLISSPPDPIVHTTDMGLFWAKKNDDV